MVFEVFDVPFTLLESGCQGDHAFIDSFHIFSAIAFLRLPGAPSFKIVAIIAEIVGTRYGKNTDHPSPVWTDPKSGHIQDDDVERM